MTALIVHGSHRFSPCLHICIPCFLRRPQDRASPTFARGELLSHWMLQARLRTRRLTHIRGAAANEVEGREHELWICSARRQLEIDGLDGRSMTSKRMNLLRFRMKVGNVNKRDPRRTVASRPPNPNNWFRHCLPSNCGGPQIQY